MSETDAAAIGLSADGLFLVFTTHGTKVFARTPLGEYAFGESQGLYEWTRDAKGRSIRIAHTGSDRTNVVDGQVTHSTARPEPRIRGHRASQSPARLN